MKLSNQLTYRQALYLTQLFSIPNFIIKLDKEIRLPIFNIKRQLEKIAEEYKYKKTSIILTEGGIEVEATQNQSSYFDLPKYKTRDKFTGSDEDYHKSVDEISSKRKNIEEKILELSEKPSSLKITPILTEKQFDDLFEVIQDLEWDSLKDILVIS